MTYALRQITSHHKRWAACKRRLISLAWDRSEEFLAARWNVWGILRFLFFFLASVDAKSARWMASANDAPLCFFFLFFVGLESFVKVNVTVKDVNDNKPELAVDEVYLCESDVAGTVITFPHVRPGWLWWPVCVWNNNKRHLCVSQGDNSARNLWIIQKMGAAVSFTWVLITFLQRQIGCNDVCGFFFSSSQVLGILRATDKDEQPASFTFRVDGESSNFSIRDYGSKPVHDFPPFFTVCGSKRCSEVLQPLNCCHATIEAISEAWHFVAESWNYFTLTACFVLPTRHGI